MAYPTVPAPTFVFTEIIDFNTLITPYESGKEKRRRKWADDVTKRRFRLVYNNKSQANTEIIRDYFLNTGKGEEISFTFANEIDGANYTCRFEKGGFSMGLVSMNGANKIYSFTVNLIQVL